MSGTGDCFRWALWDAIHNGGTLVHGWVQHPVTGTYAHAWVERDGFVHDWQRCDQKRGPCPQSLEEFDAEYLPEHEARYSPQTTKLVLKAFNEGNYGPWHPDPWSRDAYGPSWIPRTNPWFD